MKKLFSEKQEQYIKDHFQTMSYKDIAKNLGSTKTIKGAKLYKNIEKNLWSMEIKKGGQDYAKGKIM